MMGLKIEANLAAQDGIWAPRGVMRFLSPKGPIITTVAYGLQIAIQRNTLVIATLAILSSALCSALKIKHLDLSRNAPSINFDS